MAHHDGRITISGEPGHLEVMRLHDPDAHVCAQTRLDRVTQDVKVRDELVRRGVPIREARAAISDARARLRVDVANDILLREAMVARTSMPGP
jgi:hypothetical protein